MKESQVRHSCQLPITGMYTCCNDDPMHSCVLIVGTWLKESQVCNGDHTRATELELYYVYLDPVFHVLMYIRTCVHRCAQVGTFFPN